MAWGCYIMSMEYANGFYDLFETPALKKALDSCQAEHLESLVSSPLEKEALYQELPAHLAAELTEYIKNHTENLQDSALYKQLTPLLTSSDFLHHLKQHVVPSSGKKLRYILPSNALIPAMPDTPLGVCALLTGSARSPRLIDQLKKELATCDKADWIVSFIKMSGVVQMRDALERFTSTPAADGGPRLRIATTTYLGASDAKAIDFLRHLPNTEVRVSCDTKNTRLHAKAYIFHRETGFGSAYIGSSNISRVAMDDGLEWNIKVSQRELRHLWEAAIASFETHWEDTRDFEACKTDDDMSRIRRLLHLERYGTEGNDETTVFYHLEPYPFQQIALEAIERERSHGRSKHLIVAATGTGKTMLAAFDYRNFLHRCPGAKLLFIAHRKELLEQALHTFRQVLRNGSFGCLVDGEHTLTNSTHWFCTVQTWSRHAASFAPDHFDYIVVDEAHHGASSSYRSVIDELNPKSLLGLTATPERMDGASILPDFGGSFTHELRLTDAVERHLLAPFVYYGVLDLPGMDYSQITWRQGRYDVRELDAKIACNRERAAWVMSQIDQRVENIHDIRAIGFCVSIQHAEAMAQYCQEQQIKALALTSASSREQREQAKKCLENKEINIIFTVDLYNEGVDIPCVDTVIFLRPTESLCIFLQQLGRGLRRHPDKAQLVVFDFIAAQNNHFSYAKRFQALCSHHSTRGIERMVETGFHMLPGGCSITLERSAMEIVLNNIRDSLQRMKVDKMKEEIAHILREQQRHRLTLNELLYTFDLSTPDELYARSIPAALQNLLAMDEELIKYQKSLQNGLRKLLLQTDYELLCEVEEDLCAKQVLHPESLTAFYGTLFGEKKPGNLEGIHQFILERPDFVDDLRELIAWVKDHRAITSTQTFERTGSLRLHASYTRLQIELALGITTLDKGMKTREGVYKSRDGKTYIFFADINKDEEEFSPTTMYEDYAISPTLFHWQSQNKTAPQSNTGQDYIHHEERGIHIMLFIRRHRTTENGVNAPYVFLGPVHYVSHSGSKPMSVKWRIEFPIPAQVMEWAGREQ